MKSRVTQKEIARAAGVSNASVSLALRGSSSIPLPTRQRIKKIANQLGYVPDPMLSGLAIYRTSRRPAPYQSNIAWINHWPTPQRLHFPGGSFTEYYNGARARSSELGYNLEEICLEEIDFKAKRLEKILLSKGITGLLLPPYPHAGGELNINFSRFSAIRFGYSYRFPMLHTVVNAQFHTALGTFQNSIARGYKSIGIILNKDQDERTAWNFLGGFITGQRLAENAKRIEPFYPETGTPSELARWIKKNGIDCVIGLGNWPKVSKTGLAVGYADLSVDGNDDQLSGMYQSGIRIGMTAVDFLATMMHRGETGIPAETTEISIKSQWREGQTLPKLN